MLLILGIPGFLQAAWVSLPWSGLALAVWGVILWRLTAQTRGKTPEQGAFAARGCAVAPLLVSGLFISWLTARWPDPLSALLFWAPPALLLALAIFGSREHAHHGRGGIAIFVPLAAFQIQLMIYGALLFIGHIFNGGSPI